MNLVDESKDHRLHTDAVDSSVGSIGAIQP